ncbi:MAG: PEP-CTERM sorting domain-containing protein, partial [bacterium]|nr:PEP-CTERM sorting domain-containing protein [bacterium]
TALTTGTSPVDLSGEILLDSFFGDIQTALENGSVDVTAIPEPATVLLVGAALFALGLNRWRQRV